LIQRKHVRKQRGFLSLLLWSVPDGTATPRAVFALGVRVRTCLAIVNGPLA
jgi:hypothetical protein